MIGERVYALKPGPGTPDRYGDSSPSWASPTRTPLDGAVVAPRSSSEGTDPTRPAHVIVGLTLYLPLTVGDVDDVDRFEVRGQQYEVEGQPGVWVSPFSDMGGIEIALTRTEG